MKNWGIIIISLLVVFCFQGCGDDENGNLNKTTWIYTSDWGDDVTQEEILEFKRSTYRYTRIKKTTQEDGSIKEEKSSSTGDYEFSEPRVVYLKKNDEYLMKLVISEAGDVMSAPGTAWIYMFIKQ